VKQIFASFMFVRSIDIVMVLTATLRISLLCAHKLVKVYFVISPVQ